MTLDHHKLYNVAHFLTTGKPPVINGNKLLDPAQYTLALFIRKHGNVVDGFHAYIVFLTSAKNGSSAIYREEAFNKLVKDTPLRETAQYVLRHVMRGKMSLMEIRDALWDTGYEIPFLKLKKILRELTEICIHSEVVYSYIPSHDYDDEDYDVRCNYDAD